MAVGKLLYGARIRNKRRERGWDKPRLARELARVLGDDRPGLASLITYVKRWETSRSGISERYRLALAHVFDMPEEELFTLDAGFEVTAIEPAVRDADFVATLREDLHRLVTLDGRYGGSDLVPLAVRNFRRASDRMTTGTGSRDLQAAVGEAGEVAAWIAYDADRQRLCRQLNHEAMLISRLAGDRSMELFELGNMAMQSIHLGRAAEALRIAEGVLTSDRLSGRTAALFHTRRGRALAQLGDGQRSASAIRQARALLSDGIGGRDPAWSWWMDEAELIWHEAMRLLSLGDCAASVDLFREAYVRRRNRGRDDRIRAPYNDAAHLLDALVRLQAWRDAEETMRDVMAYAGKVGSQRTTALLLRVVGRIERSSAPSTLADMAADLRRLLAQPPDGLP